MSDLKAVFLDEPLSSSGARGSSAIFLSLFGKYPGWTDFVNEFYPSNSLAAAEQKFTEGLSMSGSLPIDHYFLWTRGTQSMVGSMWESHDQSGRPFPAFVCVHSIKVGMETLSKTVFDRLLEFRTTCISLVSEFGFQSHEASSSLQKAVRAEHLSMQSRLSECLPRKGQSSEISNPTANAAGAFLDSTGVKFEAGGALSLFRFLLERLSEFNLSNYRPTTPPDPCVFRVTAGGLTAREALFLWHRILRPQIHSKVPVLIVGPLSGDWVDIIVGEAKSHDLTCIRKSKQELKIQHPGGDTTGVEMTSVSDEALNEIIKSLSPSSPTPSVAHEGPHGGIQRRQKVRSAFGLGKLLGLLLPVLCLLVYLLWANWRKNENGSISQGGLSGSELLLSQPRDKEVTAGDQVLFSVKTSKPAVARYSWIEKSSARIVGTNDALYLSTVRAQGGGRFEYRVVVTVGGTAVTSRWATLVVKPMPAAPSIGNPVRADPGADDMPVAARPRITKELPSVLEIGEGNELRLRAELSSTSSTVVWYFGQERMEGLTSSNLVIRNVAAQHSGLYSFVASNASGLVTSSPTKLLVVRKPAGVVTPSPNRDVKVGEPITLPVAIPRVVSNLFGRVGTPLDLRIDGVLTNGWRWSKDGERIGTVGENYFRISELHLDSGGLYRAERTSSPEVFQEFRLWIEMTNQIGMHFVWVPGFPRTKGGGWVGKFEVTQEQYEKVMRQNPSKHQASPKSPVDSINLAEASLFCRELGNSTQISRGTRYSLLTESQWEYAARGAELIDAVTSFGRRSMRTSPDPVGTRNPNPQGLFDMRGNLWEWCLADSGEGAVCRGGSYADSSERLGSTEGALAVGKKYIVTPDARLKTVGFRCVLLNE